MIDWERVAGQLRVIAAHGGDGWSAVQEALHPELLRIARRQPIGRLRDDRDAAHEVATRVLERLHAHEFRAVKRLFETEREPVVRAWIQVLVRTAAIDVMRQHAEYRRAGVRETAGWISLATLASNPGSPAPSSLVQKQRELERFIARTLDEVDAATAEHGAEMTAVLAARWGVEPLHVRRLATKGERYLPVLRLVLAGHSYPEVATQLSLSRREVELLIQYLEQLLQSRRFAAE